MSTVNLKRNEMEKKGTFLGEAPESEVEDYYYGLEIHLKAPELQKLDLGDITVGDRLPMDIVAKVTGISEDDSGRRVTLQIQEMGKRSLTDGVPVRETVLYGDK